MHLMYAYKHTTHIHTYTHARMRACVNAHVHTHTHTVEYIVCTSMYSIYTPIWMHLSCVYFCINTSIKILPQ